MCVSITPNQLVLATQESPCLPPKVSPEQRAITATAADDIWAPEQMGKFLDHIATHRLGGCFALTLLGLRREEVGGLRWSDIDPHTGALHIRRARVDVNGRHSNISRMRAAGIAADVVAAWHGHRTHDPGRLWAGYRQPPDRRRRRLLLSGRTELGHKVSCDSIQNEKDPLRCWSERVSPWS
jgi:integrase